MTQWFIGFEFSTAQILDAKKSTAFLCGALKKNSLKKITRMSKANLLKELIIEKYGEDKFSTGCQLVAQWVSPAYTCSLIADYCSGLLQNFSFTKKENKKLFTLFGNKQLLLPEKVEADVMIQSSA